MKDGPAPAPSQGAFTYFPLLRSIPQVILWCLNNSGFHMAEETAPHTCCGLWQTGVALHCFPAHTSPSLLIEELGRAGGRLVLGTSFGGLAEGPEMATISGPEKVPLHFDGLRALGMAKERNPMCPLKPEDSFMDKTMPNMLWGWPGKPLAAPREGNCTMRPKLKAPPSKAPPHGHGLSREPSSGTQLRTSSHQDP